MNGINQHQKLFTILFLAAVFIALQSGSAYCQTTNPKVRLKIDSQNFSVAEGYKTYLNSFNLYTIVDGRSHLIARLTHRLVGIPEPLLDPSGRWVFYATNTGCGFEGEGMAVYAADVLGKKKIPILGRCRYLRPTGFLTSQGKHYLLISSESESPEKDFWLYDINLGEFVVHAEGEIKETGKGQYTYGLHDDDGNFKPVGKVTPETVIKREAPLKLLSRYPTQGLTRKPGVRLYESATCDAVEGKPAKTIAAANTKVLILTGCEDGGYEVYFNGFKGRVAKGAIKPIDFGSQK
jgi:hypothetical protein